MIGISQVCFSNVVPVRWFSLLNPEMDCVVYVPEQTAETARKKIKTAMDEWWDNDAGLGYGDAIELALNSANIPYVILYPEWNDDETACVAEWDNWADSIQQGGV